MLSIVCKKCGGPLIKKGIHHNDKQRYKCTKCGFLSIEYKIESSEDIETQPKLNETFDGPDWNIVSDSSEIRTLEQLKKFCRVDEEIWEVKKHTVNSWGSARNKNFQVKAWLTEKAPLIKFTDIKEKFNELALQAPNFPTIKYEHGDSGLMAEVNIPDLHYGQLSWGEETGQDNYDRKVAKERLITAVTYFCSILKEKKIAKILLIVGNDFYNVNSSDNTTKAGTVQSEDDRWKKTFTAGFELWVEAISLLSEIAEIEIKIVPGNHDEERVYYLGEVLRAFYSKNDNIVVDNGAQSRKYYQWGKVLLGYTHGNKEVKNYLPQLMATEQPIMWSATIWREWRTGHLHHLKQQIQQMVDGLQGVTITVLPSMTSLDDWHSGKGYTATRQAILTIYDKERGKDADYYFNIKQYL